MPPVLTNATEKINKPLSVIGQAKQIAPPPPILQCKIDSCDGWEGKLRPVFLSSDFDLYTAFVYLLSSGRYGFNPKLKIPSAPPGATVQRCKLIRSEKCGKD